jgi:flagellar basal body-associated protein FliL
MIILIVIIIILIALIGIALYTHFSKKPEPSYDPERIKLERENEERRAKARMEA